jgi:transcriptional regulator with XRE-family HTH domain
MGADENPIAVHFGNNLRSRRKRAGISQESLGYRASLHRTEVGLLERGARVPRIDTLIKLASALSIPPEELLCGIEYRPDRVQRGGFEFQDSGNVPGE